jgi:hypothetical protein
VTQDPPRVISVLSGTNGCVGFLRSAGPKGLTAYDAAGELLGLFQNKHAAIDAITAATTQIRQENHEWKHCLKGQRSFGTQWGALIVMARR